MSQCTSFNDTNLLIWPPPYTWLFVSLYLPYECSNLFTIHCLLFSKQWLIVYLARPFSIRKGQSSLDCFRLCSTKVVLIDILGRRVTTRQSVRSWPPVRTGSGMWPGVSMWGCFIAEYSQLLTGCVCVCRCTCTCMCVCLCMWGDCLCSTTWLQCHYLD